MNVKGTKEGSERAKLALLAALEDNPHLSLSQACQAVGRTSPWLVWARKADPDFGRRIDAIKQMASGDGPPPVPSFREFREKYLNVTEENPVTLKRQDVGVTYPFMEPFVEALNDKDIRRIMAIWPIRHGKTKLIEQLVVYALCQNPNASIKVICGSEGLAKDRLYAIQQILTDTEIYPELHRTWGAWIGKPTDKPWGARQFYVRGRTSGARDASVQGLGTTAKILGSRADLVILDDVDDPTNTAEGRRNIMRTINTVIRTRLNDGGRIVVIGNRVGVSDVYATLMDRQGWWIDVQSGFLEDGSPLCPEMYSADELKDLAQDLTPDEFSMMVLNDPAPEGSMMFPPHLIDGSKVPSGIREVPQGWNVIVGFDPAPAETAAIVAVAYDPQTKLKRVIDVDSRRAAGYDGAWEMIQAFVLRYRPRHVVIEAQGGSNYLGDVPQISRFVYDNGGSVVQFKTGTNKNDPRHGLGLVADEMRAGRLQFANGNVEAQSVMRPLFEDMLSFRPGPRTSHRGDHYDRLMALWFCASQINGLTTTTPRGGGKDPLVLRRPFLKGMNRRSALV